MKITSFAKIKGGVGATTIAYNYGEWLANKGYKVLFIDFDHQCNLTQTYNVFENDGTVANIFNGKGEVNILPVKENIDLIAGYIRLDNLEKELETKSYKDMLLYMWFEDNYDSKGLEKYDYIIIDCAPSLGLITINALTAADSVIIPIQCEYFALEGLGKLLNTIKNVQKIHNKDLDIEKSEIRRTLYAQIPVKYRQYFAA